MMENNNEEPKLFSFSPLSFFFSFEFTYFIIII